MKKILLFFSIFTSLIFPDETFIESDTLFRSNFQINNQLIFNDTEGRLHLAFTAQTGNTASSREIFYGIQQADSFIINQVTDNYSEEIISSIFYSDADKLHLIFLSRDSDNLMQLYYMNNASGKFSRRIQLTKSPVSKAAPKAVIDRNGRIHIVYFTNNFNSNQFCYTVFSTKNFSISNEMILCDAETNISDNADITIDGKDKIHIVFKAGSVLEGRLKYFNTTSGLVKETALNIDHPITSPRIIINNDTPHILYLNTNDKRLYWIKIKRNPGVPVAITPENHIPAGIGNFTRDNANRIYILYQNIEDSNFKSVYLIHFKDEIHSSPVRLTSINDNSIINDVSSTAYGDGLISMVLSSNLRNEVNTHANLVYTKGYLFGNALANVHSDSLSFGERFIDFSYDQNIKISNTGTTILKVFNPSIQGRDFTVDQFDTLYIMPDSSIDVRVSFNPSDTIKYFSMLSISCNAVNGNVLKIKLDGSGSGYPKIITLKDTFYVYDTREFIDSVLIINKGLKLLQIDSVKTSHPDINVSYSDEALYSGDSLYLKVNIRLKRNSSGYLLADTIFIYSNDPLDKFKYIFVKSVNLTANDKESNAGIDYELFQNYPNPFNPSTTISFSISQASYIIIEVYDALAREIAELADGYYPAGVHNINFNADDLSTGIYYYKLRVKSGAKELADHVKVRKMILVK